MRRIRTLAILASLAIAVGGAGLARAETKTLAASQQSATPSAAADPPSKVSCAVHTTTDHNVSASDTGSTPGTGGTITGYQIDWGDGSHTAVSATAPANVPHHYTGNGPFAVNETLFGTPASAFGGDGHETDECAGSPISFTPPPDTCSDDEGAGCTDKVDCSESDDNSDAECKTAPPTTEKPECREDDAKGCDDKVDCTESDDAAQGDCDRTPRCTDATNDDAQNCPDKPDCTEADDANDTSCPPPPPPPPPPCPGGEQRVIFHGKLVCEFDFATFYSAESGPMKVVVDASAVNGPSTNNSHGQPLPGDKVLDTNCADALNSCNAATNRDADHDITKYVWDFVAWRADANEQPVFVEKHTVDSGLNPQAAVQFTKTQGDDVVQITLTIIEGAEGSTAVIAGPKPVFPIMRDGVANSEDLSPNVIIEPCDQPGLVLPATIGDTLIDGGIPLNEPNANGALSSAILQGTIGTPLAPVGQEVACLINVLPGV